MHRSRVERAIALALVLLLHTSMSRAQQPPALTPEAQPHLARALKHYDAKEYAKAAAAIEATYAIDPNSDLLYMWAQSVRLTGDCAAAVPLYERYLATRPAPAEAERAQTNLARCEPARVATPPSHPAASALVVDASVARHPWYGDKLAHALAGSGLVVLGVGGGLELAARSSLVSARAAGTYREADDRADAASLRHRAALGAVAVGSALLLTAAVRYLVAAVRE